jgi:ribonuclease-3
MIMKPERMASEPTEPPERGAPAAARPGIDPAVADLAARLGVELPDAALALSALTHKSYVNEHRGEVLSDNERLEFLGDAVIDLAVSHRLMERFPEAREGDLSKIRAAVVDEAGLARVARELDLGALLRLGRGEELTGGRHKSSLLADAMEAVIAAMYLMGGLEPVLGFVDRFLGEAFARATAGTLDRDYKTQFQELAQSRLRATPRYRVVAEHGPDHSKTFDVELELRGDVVGRGAGRSKKDAEQAAAKNALEAMNGKGEEAVGSAAKGNGSAEEGERSADVAAEAAAQGELGSGIETQPDAMPAVDEPAVHEPAIETELARQTEAERDVAEVVLDPQPATAEAEDSAPQPRRVRATKPRARAAAAAKTAKAAAKPKAKPAPKRTASAARRRKQ